MESLVREAESLKEQILGLKKGGQKQYYVGYIHGLQRAIERLEKMIQEQTGKQK